MIGSSTAVMYTASSSEGVLLASRIDVVSDIDLVQRLESLCDGDSRHWNMVRMSKSESNRALLVGSSVEE